MPQRRSAPKKGRKAPPSPPIEKVQREVPSSGLPEAPASAKTAIRLAAALLVLGLFLWGRGGFRSKGPGDPVLTPAAGTPGAVDLSHTDQPIDMEFDGIRAIRGSTGWGGYPKKDQAIMGGLMTMSGKTYPHGIGTHAPSTILFELKGRVSRFKCSAGVDDRGGKDADLILMVVLDGKKIYRSPAMKAGSPPQALDLGVAGGKELELVVDPNGDQNWDQADWADLQFIH